MSSTHCILLLALMFSHAAPQLITTKTIQALVKNIIKAPSAARNTNIYPRELSKPCPCGCGNPTKCKGPLINALNINPICQCGKNGCQCHLTAYPELPVCLKPTNILESFGLSNSNTCGCDGPCQCQKGQCAIPNIPTLVPTFTPTSEAYFVPDLTMYQVPIKTPLYLTPVEFVDFPDFGSLNTEITFEFFSPVQRSVKQCDCGKSDCRCQKMPCRCPNNECTCPKTACGCPNNACTCPKMACGCPSNACTCPIMACGCPNKACTCPKMACGCPNNACTCPKMPCGCPNNACTCPTMACGCPNNNCQCFQNSIRPVSFLEMPVSNIIELSCDCGRPSCDCPMSQLPPFVGSGKYLRQVTIQPPFM